MLCQLAEDTTFSGNDLYTFSAFPSGTEVPDGKPTNLSTGLDGGVYAQSPVNDPRPIILRFQDMIQHQDNADVDSIIRALRSRLYTVTGLNYYLRAKPEYISNVEDTTGTVSGDDNDEWQVNGASWTNDQWIEYALVDSNDNSFRITDNNQDTIWWDSDDGAPTGGHFTIVDRKSNFLYKWNDGQGDAPIQVQIMFAQITSANKNQSLQQVVYDFECRMYPVFS